MSDITYSIGQPINVINYKIEAQDNSLAFTLKHL